LWVVCLYNWYHSIARGLDACLPHVFVPQQRICACIVIVFAFDDTKDSHVGWVVGDGRHQLGGVDSWMKH
jgi:hypothetical protein